MIDNVTLVVVVVGIFELVCCGYYIFVFPPFHLFPPPLKFLGTPFTLTHLIGVSSGLCSLGIMPIHKPHPSI